jgi:hypothetical protein
MRMCKEWVMDGFMQMLGGIGVLRSLNAMMELGASPLGLPDTQCAGSCENIFCSCTKAIETHSCYTFYIVPL